MGQGFYNTNEWYEKKLEELHQKKRKLEAQCRILREDKSTLPTEDVINLIYAFDEWRKENRELEDEGSEIMEWIQKNI